MSCYGQGERKVQMISEPRPTTSVIAMEQKKLPLYWRRQPWYTNAEEFFSDAFEPHSGVIFIVEGIGISSICRMVGAICR